MPGSIGALIYWVGIVPLIAQWIGLAVTRDRRNGGWWTMAGGTSVQTIGQLGVTTVGTLLFSGWGRRLVVFPPSSDDVFLWLHFSSLGLMAGGIVFGAGFAIWCVKSRGARERERQLEAMTAAMAEELRILRERAG